MRPTLTKLNQVVEAAGGLKKVLVLAVALLAAGAAGADTVRRIRNLPEQIQTHDNRAATAITEMQQTHNAQLAELQAIRKAHEQQLCLQIAQLRRGDWTQCLLH